ncbi:MAG: hypothetical protein HOM55_09150 [Proteobacteria bacterium]|jgi:protein tyrosine phosphatase (PTP) superfamily phosphohydrolase (DUF442 family)|nr:hypothetical protein [Pseudomonadota bacterium]
MMKTIRRLAVMSVFAFLTIGCSSLATTQNTLNVEAIQNSEIMNLNHPEASVFSAGQPTQEQLTTLGNSGIKHVVSLRPASELDWNEQEYVESIDGVTYHNIPIDGAGDINPVNAASLQSLLKSFGNEPVLVHCGSSNRVGALAAISEAQENGASTDAAVEEGKRWGLTRLEPAVRAALSE